MRTVVVLRENGMGHGDEALGHKILGAFLRKVSGAVEGLEAIVLYNSGVQLLCGDSPFVADFHQLEENGVDVLACGTCLEHLGLEARTGTVSNMDEILREMAKADKVITL